MKVAGSNEPKLYSLVEAGEVLGVSHWTLREHISRGAIRPTRVGKLVKVSSTELQRLIEEGLPKLSRPQAQAVEA